MQIFKTNLFKTNNIEINLNNRTKKSSEVFVTEPISKYEIPNHYYPAFKSNVEIYEKMKKVSSKNLNIEELKKLKSLLSIFQSSYLQLYIHSLCVAFLGSLF